MEKSTSNKRKYVKLRKIWRNKMLTRAVKYIGIAIVSFTSQGSAAGIGEKEQGNDGRKIDRSEWLASLNQKTIAAPEIDIQVEIEKRVDWFVEEYIQTLKTRQAELLALKGYNAKQNYIKKNFFDRVFEAGRLGKGSNYCVAAAMGCLLDLNDKTGDLENFFPDGSTRDGRAMVSCSDFITFVKKNYKDCLKEYTSGKNGVLKTKSGEVYKPEELKEGMILVQESKTNTSSGWHTVVYIGNGQVLSFNNDKIYNLNKRLPTNVIDLPEIIRQEWDNRVKEMPQEKREDMIAMLGEFYVGRESEFMKTMQMNAPDMANFSPVADENLLQIMSGKDVVDLTPQSLDKTKNLNAWHLFAKMAGKDLDS